MHRKRRVIDDNDNSSDNNSSDNDSSDVSDVAAAAASSLDNAATAAADDDDELLLAPVARAPVVVPSRAGALAAPSRVSATAPAGSAVSPATAAAAAAATGAQSEDAAAVVPSTGPFVGTASFSSLGLAPFLLKVVAELGYRHPSRIQLACIPQILKGRDIIGAAHTGSGKTAAFALPILHALADDIYGIFALVLTPTRELAMQIAEQFQLFGRPLHVQVALVVGGRDMHAQALDLGRRPHIVVATPGRLADHLSSTPTLALNRVKYLVLDEADRLLDASFAGDLAAIRTRLTPLAQLRTLLFSATMPEDMPVPFRDPTPFRFDADSGLLERTVSSLLQQYMFMPKAIKHCYLVYLLRHQPSPSTIIFAGSCKSAAMIKGMLRELELNSTALHSMMSQEQRSRSLHRFKSARVGILVATDVASRGLDIPQVELVLHFDIPREPTDYIHRAGRTARAGRGGRSIALVSQYDIESVHRIEAHTGKKLEEFPAEEGIVLRHLDESAIALRLASVRLQESDYDQKREMQKLKHGAHGSRWAHLGADAVPEADEQGAAEVDEPRRKSKKSSSSSSASASASASADKKSRKPSAKQPASDSRPRKSGAARRDA